MKYLITFLLSLSFLILHTQENVGYQSPAKEILELVDVPLPPQVIIDSKGEYAVLMYRDAFKTIEEMSEPEMRLAGLRINPKTNIGSRTRFYFNVRVLDISSGKIADVKGLPINAKLSKFVRSPNEKLIAMTHTNHEGVELWYLEIETAQAKKLTGARINANISTTMMWQKDNQSLLVKMIPEDRKDLINANSSVPNGPTISVSQGKKAQNRTYQDLLKNTMDEFNFEQLTRSSIVKVDLQGNAAEFLEPAMYTSLSSSPDGNYILVSKIGKPFSYLVPYYRYPTETNLHSNNGDFVRNILSVPLIEDLPKGRMAVRMGMRNLQWRSDKASSLVWAEALDEGDPAKEVEYRDGIYCQDDLLAGEKRMIFKSKNRIRNLMWANDHLAFATDRWWKNRNTKTYAFDPSDPKNVQILNDRNYQDMYSDPGNFVMKRNKFGRNVVDVDNDFVYLMGDGYSDEGIRPFIDKLNLTYGTSERLWRADGKNSLERIITAIDAKEGVYITRKESKSEFPNYYLRNINSKKRAQQITNFENPFKSIANVQKEVINYKRDDGLDLSATLYLPSDYDKESGDKLPMLMWAYPREFKDKNSASQVTSSPHQFTYPSYGSPIFWVAKGYAVLDRAAFPIVGEGDSEPNDFFVEQLVANAKAGIDAVDALGYIDRTRVGVGGHSYGAFMTANLLSHSDLFAAGIARSGAYNRTLTPYGFQSEQRTYWEAPEIYYAMSPFMHADKVKTPILLIHGEADNNSGTYPIQSIRYFNALKGMGAIARLVMLPKESHGYSAKESILHMLWEQDQWMEKYVKNKPEKKEVYLKP